MRRVMRAMTASARFRLAHDSGNGGDVRVDVGQRPRRQPEKAHTRLQDFADRLQLIRNGRQHQVRLGGEDLLLLRCP